MVAVPFVRIEGSELGERLEKQSVRAVETFVIGVLIRQLRLEWLARLERIVPIIYEATLKRERFRQQIAYRSNT
jgi:hypothetical protein